ncbi:response regulator transcription factor [Streptosporangium sp. NPDC002544]|uniref:response regulator transcription factor n=1 Tax=Streptosporangium sp. NPDC002544 TaxID=3154538 RepID=UPI00332C6DF6
MTIRVLIADDHAMVRAGFGALLAAERDIEVVGDAADGEQAVAQTRRLCPDVVLMDVRMPGLDGLRAARLILTPPPREHRPRVLMLTTFDVDDYVYEALRAGASGFLLKEAPPGDLISAVRVVAAGDALLAPSVTRRLIEEVVRCRPALPSSPSRTGRLTEREAEVLLHIARGLSNTEIAAALVVAEQTVKTHIGRILTKLDLRDRAQAIVFAYESGLVIPRSGLPLIPEAAPAGMRASPLGARDVLGRPYRDLGGVGG